MSLAFTKADLKRITLSRGGRWSAERGMTFCPAHDNVRTPALSLGLGSNGSLLAYCFAGCTFPEILAGLRRDGHLDDDHRLRPSRSLRPSTDRRFDAEQKRCRARQLWSQGIPVEGTLAERYLRARAIQPPWPKSLRFHRCCWHEEGTGSLPALLAEVERDGETAAVQRIYLAQRWRSLPRFDRRRTVHPPRLRAGRAARAESGDRLADGDGPLFVAEGIETALSVRDGLGCGFQVWATLGTAGMKALYLPPPGEGSELVIASDGDQSGRAAANALANRASSEGWRVRLVPAPEGLDWNDVAINEASRRAAA